MAGEEACDDGNTIPGDGCDDTCRIERGWLCPSEGGACANIQQNSAMCDIQDKLACTLPPDSDPWATCTTGVPDRPVCTWLGVTCSPTGLITSIKLTVTDANCTGIISEAIGMLVTLTELDFTDNMLVGSLPSTLSETALETLILVGNDNMEKGCFPFLALPPFATW